MKSTTKKILKNLRIGIKITAICLICNTIFISIAKTKKEEPFFWEFINNTKEIFITLESLTLITITMTYAISIFLIYDKKKNK